MKLRHVVAVTSAVLAGVAFWASAQDADVTVGSEDACPAGTYASVPSYRWQDGQFVRDGWLCKSLYEAK
jgi:hypothetical protein